MLSFTVKFAPLSVVAGAMALVVGGSPAVAQTSLDACGQPEMASPHNAAPQQVSLATPPSARPKARKVQPVKAAAGKAEAGKPEAAKPDVTKPEAGKPEPAKPGPEKAPVGSAEAAKPAVAEPAVAKPPVAKPAVAKAPAGKAQAVRKPRRVQTDAAEQGASAPVVQAPLSIGPGAAPRRSCPAVSTASLMAPPAAAIGGQDLFKPADRQPLKLVGAAGAPPVAGIASFLPAEISVETASVPELSAAMARYGSSHADGVIGAVVSLVEAHPAEAVKIALAAHMAWPNRALELAMVIAGAAPSTAVQIVAAFAKIDPALVQALADMILPAAGGINQTSSNRGSTAVLQEIAVRMAPGDASASATGRR